MELKRQHLIDPVVCIRCNTCEETCPVNAITHDSRNYVVDSSICKSCRACVPPCPTGAIDSWLMTSRPWTLDEQFSWDELPPEATLEEGLASGPEPAEVTAIIDVATASTGGRTPPPYSAAHPYVNIYTRENPITARVAANYALTDADAESDIRHIVLDFGLKPFPVIEGQSVGIIPPGADDNGRPYNMRLYSVASPRDGERPNHNNLALTVKRVVIKDESGNVVQKGVGSNFVCDLKKGDEVLVAGPFGDTFLMPNHPQANIVMICTGTGAAPFRGFTERRRRKATDVPGKLMLFFGARSPGELPYCGPLAKLSPSLIDVNLAYSRVPEHPKEYVQDKMRARGDELAKLLKSEHTYIYVCGLKDMEHGVDEAIADVCRLHGMDWDELKASMRREGRYHVETY
jgi:benzoyl-CoA 2,3-epoxidase subunit A